MKALVLAAVLVATLTAAPAAAQERAVVTHDGLRLRQTPSLEAGLVTMLDRGAVVQILDRTAGTTRIGTLEAPWYRVRRGEREGWTYGAYLAFNILVNPALDIVVYFQEDPKDPLLVTYHILSPSREVDRKQEIYEAQVRFSPSLHYYVVTDLKGVVGGIAIHDCLTGEMVHHARIVAPAPAWNGEDLTFRAVVREEGGLIRWQGRIFRAGVVADARNSGTSRTN